MARRQKVAVTGGIAGPMHIPTAYLLNGGRSLHPLQRTGAVSHSGYSPLPAAAQAGQGSAPAAGAPDLTYPARLTPGITSNPALRVG